MSDLTYLQDSTWLAEREKKWQLMSKQWLSSVSDDQRQARRDYFFTGDIEQCILNVDDPSLYTVISDVPLIDVNLVVDNITRYWFWVMDSPDTRDRFRQFPDIDERFIFHFHAIFSLKDDNLHPDICTGLFFWLYGETYQQDRVVTIKHNDRTATIPVNVNVNELSFSLLSGIIDYLWGKDEGENICIFKSFIPYFLSLYPHMSPCCFSTTLPDKSEFIDNDGKQYSRAWYIWNRYLLTTINGFITKYEVDDGIDELVCNDDDALKQLKEGLNALQMPEEFYRLQEFVLKHKGESLKASE